MPCVQVPAMACLHINKLKELEYAQVDGSTPVLTWPRFLLVVLPLPRTWHSPSERGTDADGREGVTLLPLGTGHGGGVSRHAWGLHEVNMQAHTAAHVVECVAKPKQRTTRIDQCMDLIGVWRLFELIPVRIEAFVLSGTEHLPASGRGGLSLPVAVKLAKARAHAAARPRLIRRQWLRWHKALDRRGARRCRPPMQRGRERCILAGRERQHLARC